MTNNNNDKIIQKRRMLTKYAELNEQEEKFCKLYIETGNAYKSFVTAFPEYLNWKRASIDTKLYRYLKNEKISQRIEEIKTAKKHALEKSITLNKKKLINEAIDLFQKCKESPAQYSNAINVLKLLFNKEGLNNEGGQIQVNINNAPIINEITNYLDI